MIAINQYNIQQYEVELNDAQNSFGNIYKKLSSFNSFYLKRLYRHSLKLLILLVSIPFLFILIPIAYFYVAKKLREVVLISQKIKEVLPELSIDELKELMEIRNSVLNKFGINREQLKEVSGYPTIIKPLAFTIKEALDSFSELDEMIEAEYNQSVKMLQDALDAEPNFTLID